MPTALLTILPQILQGIQIAINAAPTVASLVNTAKAWFDALFEGGLVTVEQQAALHQYVDGVVALAKSGVIPPHWQVESDPATPAVTPAPSK